MRFQNVVLMSLLVASFALPGSLADEPQRLQENDCQENSEFKCCGDIQLVFRNPDLKAGSDGKVHAAGQLFAQFQAIGADADKIEVFGFSFSAAPFENEETVCDQEPWAPSGAYVINYRADLDESDGYFINLQTTLVPDGEYMAAVHAYDSSDNEIARAWTLAVVDNCDGDTGARCDSDDYPTQEHIDHDITMPWPIMLPGDGALDTTKNSAPDGSTLTLEFAEPLAELRVYLNGQLLHEKGGVENMTKFDGRNWDDDLIPGYGPYGLGGQAVPECMIQQEPVMACNTLGEAYAWNGRVITDDDVVRVEAVDLAGNLARKEIHIGSGASGAITEDFPNLQITVDTLTQTIAAGESALFKFELQNTGGSQGHPFASAEGPEGWELTWAPEHVPVDPGARATQELGVRVPAGHETGTYTVNATIVYDKGGGNNKEQTWNLKVNVGSGGGVGGGDGDGDGDGEAETKSDSKDSPGLPLIVALAALAGMALRRRR